MLVVCSIPHSQNLDILKKSIAQVESDFYTFMVLCMATSAFLSILSSVSISNKKDWYISRGIRWTIIHQLPYIIQVLS